jgi:hypothetical protein
MATPTDTSLEEARCKDRWRQLASLTLDTTIRGDITEAHYWYLWVEYGVEPDQLCDNGKLLQFLRSSEFKQMEGTLEGEQPPTGRADSISPTIRAIHNKWEATRPRYWVPEVPSKAQDRRDQEWRDLPIRQLRGQTPQ